MRNEDLQVLRGFILHSPSSPCFRSHVRVHRCSSLFSVLTSHLLIVFLEMQQQRLGINFNPFPERGINKSIACNISARTLAPYTVLAYTILYTIPYTIDSMANQHDDPLDGEFLNNMFAMGILVDIRNSFRQPVDIST